MICLSFPALCRQEMMDCLGLVNRPHFTEYYLKPLIQSGRLVPLAVMELRSPTA